MIKRSKHTRGFVALTSVLVLGAILLSITISTASRSITAADLGTALYAKEKAETLAHLCAEHALIELERTLGYVGDESIVVGDESCDILTITGTGNTERTISSMSTVGGHVHRTRVIVSSVSPDLTITSWESVSSF